MGLTRRRFPKYDPATDGTLTMWVDPSDSTKVLAVGGGAITNGATIGTINTSGGTARAFTQWGSNTRPTWESAGINGLGTVRFNSQIITTSTVTGFASMSGSTWLGVIGKVGATGCAFSMSALDNSIVQLFNDNTYGGGGRRLVLDSFQSQSGSSTPTNYILGIVFNYSAATISIFESGVKGIQGATFQSSGTSEPSPQEISYGGFAQQSGSAAAGLNNGRAGEVLVWNQALSADTLVGPFAYLRHKWGIL
jgi:hypothetical protein